MVDPGPGSRSWLALAGGAQATGSQGLALPVGGTAHAEVPQLLPCQPMGGSSPMVLPVTIPLHCPDQAGGSLYTHQVPSWPHRVTRIPLHNVPCQRMYVPLGLSICVTSLTKTCFLFLFFFLWNFKSVWGQKTDEGRKILY